MRCARPLPDCVMHQGFSGRAAAPRYSCVELTSDSPTKVCNVPAPVTERSNDSVKPPRVCWSYKVRDPVASSRITRMRSGLDDSGSATDTRRPRGVAGGDGPIEGLGSSVLEGSCDGSA